MLTPLDFDRSPAVECHNEHLLEERLWNAGKSNQGTNAANDSAGQCGGSELEPGSLRRRAFCLHVGNTVLLSSWLLGNDIGASVLSCIGSSFESKSAISVD